MSKKALVIGIDEYPFGKLHGCVNDANEVSALLKENGDKTPNFDVELVVDKKRQGKNYIYSLIEKLFKNDEEIALLYFAGHGYDYSPESKREGGIVCIPEYEQENSRISFKKIIDLANKSKCLNKVIILDCCYSGAIGNSIIGDKVTLGKNVVILTSCRDSEGCVERNGHGLFTSLLIESLKGRAADILGNITPASVYSCIDQALGSWEQRPYFKANVSEFIKLRTIKPVVSYEELKEVFALFNDSCFKLNPSFEFTNNPKIEHEYVEPYADKENVRIFQILQKLNQNGLVRPVGEKFMYFAAMNSKSCKLTDIGEHYINIINKNNK